MIASAAVGLLTYAGLLMVPPRYASEAQIGLGRPGIAAGNRNVAGGAEVAALQLDREAIASRVQELRSPDLARKLAAEMRLDMRPEFNSALDNPGLLGGVLRMAGVGAPRPGETEEERVLAAYYKALQVYQVKDTRVITLGFTARDSELAAAATNRLIELYQDWLRQQNIAETTDANAWLAPEIEKRTRELADAEAAVERFRSTANLFRGGSGQSSGLAEQQLTDLLGELTKARAQRGEAEARSRTARELMTRGTPDAIPDVQKSPVIQGLIAQRVRAERDLAEASSQLLPAHPRMKQLNANVADIRRQVQREASTVVDGLEREVKVLALREELAQRALDDAKSRVGDKAGDRVRLAQLEDDAKAKRRELENLRDRFEATRTSGTVKAGPVEVQVISTARPSSRPAWPNRPQIAALAAAATFVLGLVSVLFRELLAGGQRANAPARHAEPELAETSIEPALAPQPRAPVVVPQATATPGSLAGKAIAEAPRAESGEARVTTIAGVVARLLGNSAGQGGYRTLVVGDGVGIDVREQAADIAAGLSSAGRQVVLVDWSLDGHGIAEALGVEASPGFTDLLAGRVSFEDVIRVLPDGDVHVLACGSASDAGSAGLDPDRINILLDALDEAYADVVVTGSYSAIRDLFLAIEGRFDAGILVAGPNAGAVDPGDQAKRFLGFDVTEIDVVRLERSQPAVASRRSEPRRAGRGLGAAAVMTPAT